MQNQINDYQRSNTWFVRAMVAFDRRLRDRHHVFEYTSDPECVLRVRIGRLESSLMLSDGTAACAGDRILDLHLWNDQVPTIPTSGASIAWARRMNASVLKSLHELAQFLRNRPDLDDISIVRANTAFGGHERRAKSIRLMRHYGFEAAPALPESFVDRSRRVAENVLITALVLAHNRAAIRGDTLRRERTPLFISRAAFERRYLNWQNESFSSAPLPRPE